MDTKENNQNGKYVYLYTSCFSWPHGRTFVVSSPKTVHPEGIICCSSPLFISIGPTHLLTYLPVIYTGFSETSARLFMNITTLLIFMNFFDIYTLMRVSFLCYAQNGSFAWVIVE